MTLLISQIDFYNVISLGEQSRNWKLNSGSVFISLNLCDLEQASPPSKAPLWTSASAPESEGLNQISHPAPTSQDLLFNVEHRECFSSAPSSPGKHEPPHLLLWTWSFQPLVCYVVVMSPCLPSSPRDLVLVEDGQLRA